MSRTHHHQEVNLHHEYTAEQQDPSHHRFNLGADIAKKIHVARACNARGVELEKPLTFENSRRGFEKLVTWIRSLMLNHGCDNVVFGVEPTGHYWMNLAQFLRYEGVQVVLVNPLHVMKTKELEDNSPTKNDRKDARVISQLVKDGRYSVPHIPEDIYAELRVGMNERDRLSEDLKRVQGRCRAKGFELFLNTPQDTANGLENGRRRKILERAMSYINFAD